MTGAGARGAGIFGVIGVACPGGGLGLRPGGGQGGIPFAVQPISMSEVGVEAPLPGRSKGPAFTGDCNHKPDCTGPGVQGGILHVGAGGGA